MEQFIRVADIYHVPIHLRIRYDRPTAHIHLYYGYVQTKTPPLSIYLLQNANHLHNFIANSVR